MKQFLFGNSPDSVNDLFPDRVIKRLLLDEEEIGVLRIGNTFFAFQSSCPHRGASLIQAHINGQGEIICPLHQYRFDLKTGMLKMGFCGDLKIFQTQLTEEGLLVFTQ